MTHEVPGREGEPRPAVPPADPGEIRVIRVEPAPAAPAQPAEPAAAPSPEPVRAAAAEPVHPGPAAEPAAPRRRFRGLFHIPGRRRETPAEQAEAEVRAAEVRAAQADALLLALAAEEARRAQVPPAARPAGEPRARAAGPEPRGRQVIYRRSNKGPLAAAAITGVLLLAALNWHEDLGRAKDNLGRTKDNIGSAIGSLGKDGSSQGTQTPSGAAAGSDADKAKADAATEARKKEISDAVTEGFKKRDQADAEKTKAAKDQADAAKAAAEAEKARAGTATAKTTAEVCPPTGVVGEKPEAPKLGDIVGVAVRVPGNVSEIQVSKMPVSVNGYVNPIYDERKANAASNWEGIGPWYPVAFSSDAAVLTTHGNVGELIIKGIPGKNGRVAITLTQLMNHQDEGKWGELPTGGRGLRKDDTLQYSFKGMLPGQKIKVVDPDTGRQMLWPDGSPVIYEPSARGDFSVEFPRSCGDVRAQFVFDMTSVAGEQAPEIKVERGPNDHPELKGEVPLPKGVIKSPIPETK